MVQWPRSPRSHPKKPRFSNSVSSRSVSGSAMFPRYRDTRRMDHVRLHLARLKPARQPEAVATGFEGQCNPRDLAAGLDRLIAPAMQQGKQPFWARLQLLARLTLKAGKHAGNQPARLAHLDHGNDRAILVGATRDLLKSFGWGIRALHQLATATMVPSPRRLPHTISPLEEGGLELSVRALDPASKLPISRPK